MQSSSPIRVVVIDGDGFRRSGLSQVINREADLEVVGKFRDGAEAIAETRDLQPGVVLVSSDLPDMSGLEVCVQLMGLTLPPRVIHMFSEISDSVIFSSWIAGAAGVLLKDGPHEDLVKTVRANGRGELFHIAAVGERIMRSAQNHARHIDLDLLTDRERQIMVLVAQGLSNTQIGAELQLTRRTVRNYLSRVYEKLGISSRAEVGVFAMLMGTLASDGKGETQEGTPAPSETDE